ncbi:MAG: hypothetical protein M1817_002079 [Caeruleum heppii]|nr:MAG: hypothetical protein M1817_002079 [Caeruleum heppii]
MRSTLFPSSLVLAATLLSIPTTVTAQTYSTCNPSTSGSCPPNTALGKSISIDFTQGIPDSFTPQGNPTFDGNGASFTVAKSGDSPQINSKFYIMFGKVEVNMKAASGTGIVSSAVLQSDVLDEIDWEWLGADPNQVQSNYFGKGQTTTYNRGAFHPDPNNQASFQTYTIDWTADQIVWSIDGTTVRALRSTEAAPGQYPQTPMQVKLGAWSGGDATNAPGTIQWAGGPTDYSAGPYSMQVKSLVVTDYSTGTQYTYSGSDGTWQSITAVGGSVNPSGSGSSGSTGTAAVAPTVTSASPSMPYPFEGTHRDTSSGRVTPSVYPWVANPSTMETSVAVATTYPGLPAGWTVSDSGKVLPPPSAAPQTSQPVSSSPPSQAAFASPSSGENAPGVILTTSYDQRGFPTVVPVNPNPGSRVFNDQGFEVTAGPAAPSAGAGATITQKGLRAAEVQGGDAATGAATGMVNRMAWRGIVVGAVMTLSLLVLGASLW